MTPTTSWFLIILFIVCFVEAGFILVFLVNRSRRRRHEEELARLRLQAWHADRIARLRAITSSLAHDLRQPLTAILSNSQAALQFLRLDNPDLSEVRAALNDIVTDNRHASAVIDGIGDLLPRIEARRDRIDLAAAIEEVLAILKADIAGSGVLVRFAPATELEVAADKSQIQLVLINLIMNGIKAMQNRPTHDRQLDLALTLAGPGVAQVTVSDSGPGIPEERRGRLFDPFWAAKGQGTGIGLSICRTIVQAHGGKIWHEDRPGGGAIFSFTLPAVTAENAEMPTVASPEAATVSSLTPTGGGAELPSRVSRVLIIDDSAPFRRAVISKLQELPLIEISGEAADGVEAAQKAEDLQPDIILLDVSLPGINGIDLASRLRGVSPCSRLLFLSQYDDPDIVRAVLHTGALGYVMKVDIGKDLLPAVASVLQGEKFLSASVRSLDPTA